MILYQAVSQLLSVCSTHGNKCLRRTPLNNTRLRLQLSDPRFPRRPSLQIHSFLLEYIAFFTFHRTLSEPFSTNLEPLRSSRNLKIQQRVFSQGIFDDFIYSTNGNTCKPRHDQTRLPFSLSYVLPPERVTLWPTRLGIHFPASGSMTVVP